MFENKLSPVLKWAGGKTQLLEHIAENMPTEYNNYYEPFLGGASVLFGILPEKAFVNDINKQLINLYVQLKNDVEGVIGIINKLDSITCNKELYYDMRNRYNAKIIKSEFDAECAALMIWINKHCFNGLYRVNKGGLFNVPYNNKTNGKSIDENNAIAISEYLNTADVRFDCTDFMKACEGIKSGDFVYFDSPYVPESLTASFTDYTIDGFTYNDHRRLAVFFKQLDKLGVKIMLSNNDIPLVRHLYTDYNIQSINVKRMINRNANNRTGKEVLITNY